MTVQCPFRVSLDRNYLAFLPVPDDRRQWLGRKCYVDGPASTSLPARDVGITVCLSEEHGNYSFRFETIRGMEGTEIGLFIPRVALGVDWYLLPRFHRHETTVDLGDEGFSWTCPRDIWRLPWPRAYAYTREGFVSAAMAADLALRAKNAGRLHVDIKTFQRSIPDYVRAALTPDSWLKAIGHINGDA